MGKAESGSGTVELTGEPFLLSQTILEGVVGGPALRLVFIGLDVDWSNGLLAGETAACVRSARGGWVLAVWGIESGGAKDVEFGST